MQKELPQKLLRELLKNSKRSDRDLSKILKVSQPTITRTRHKLEKSGMIQDYTIVPDFKKMGFKLMTILLVKIRPKAMTPEIIDKAKEYATKGYPNVILSTLGEGMGMNGVAISFHKSYAEFQRQLNELRLEWKDFLEDIRIFIIPLGEGEFKRFSLTYLKDVPL
jgi:DNA-binding Lrp family transcriptional regulator